MLPFRYRETQTKSLSEIFLIEKIEVLCLGATQHLIHRKLSQFNTERVFKYFTINLADTFFFIFPIKIISRGNE